MSTGPGTGPRFSVVTPVYAPPIDILRRTVESVLAQTLPDWQFVLVDDCSPDPAVCELLREYAAAEPRITLVERSVNGHIAAASNDGIAAARGEFVCMLDHDDLLHPHALAEVDAAIAAFDDVDYVYTDEDKVDLDERFFDAFIKPDWSLERFRHQMYTCHLSVFRRSLVEELGGFRAGYDGSQDHDLVLRVVEQARRVVHVPRVLYHWRTLPGSTAHHPDAKPYAWVAGRNAVQDHLDRSGLDAVAEFGPSPGHYRIRRRVDPARPVSVVIPTRGVTSRIWGEARTLVIDAVRAVIELAGGQELDIIVVYDEDTPAEVLSGLRALDDRVRLVPFAGPFNFSAKVNLGVLHASSDRVVLLNDDVLPRSARWLPDLLGPLDEPDVGMTGAALFLSDGTVQHAGHRYADGVFGHPFVGALGGDPGTFGALWTNRETTGVTAACAALRRDVFLEVGGMSEVLPVNYNDVDLSCKIRAAGYRILWVATAELYHFESRSRTSGVAEWERAAIELRWGLPDRDPYLPLI